MPELIILPLEIPVLIRQNAYEVENLKQQVMINNNLPLDQKLKQNLLSM